MKYILQSCCIVFGILAVFILLINSFLGIVWLTIKCPVLTIGILIVVAILIIANSLKKDERR